MTPPRVTVREVVSPADPAMLAGHRLLRRAFHKNELVPVGEWRNSLREREAGLWWDICWHLVVAERGGVVIGLASGTYLGNVNTGVVGYLVVSPLAQGAGVGPRLRRRLRDLFHRDARRIAGMPLEGVIGEVRPDNPWLARLIRRDKALALDFEYFQPSLHAGEPAVPLVLYYESLDRIRRRLPAAKVRRLLFTTWRRIYRIARPMARREFRRMLASLQGRTFIGRLKLSDLSALRAVGGGGRPVRSRVGVPAQAAAAGTGAGRSRT
jgi:hypothetical protein